MCSVEYRYDNNNELIKTYPCRKDVLFKVLTATCLDPLTLLRLALGSLDIQTSAGEQRNLELALVQQEIGMIRMTQIPVETRI